VSPSRVPLGKLGASAHAARRVPDSGTAASAALNEVKGLGAAVVPSPLGCARGFGQLRSASARSDLAEPALRSVATNGLRTARAASRAKQYPHQPSPAKERARGRDARE
jgi:hypothetical protein